MRTHANFFGGEGSSLENESWKAQVWEVECMEGLAEASWGPLHIPTDAFLGVIPALAQTEASCLGQMVDSVFRLLSGVWFA